MTVSSNNLNKVLIIYSLCSTMLLISEYQRNISTSESNVNVVAKTIEQKKIETQVVPLEKTKATTLLQQQAPVVEPSVLITEPKNYKKIALESVWNSIERYVTLTDEKRNALLDLHRKYQEIYDSNLSEEDKQKKLKELPSQDEVLGPELTQKLQDVQASEEEHWKDEGAERGLAFLENSMGIQLTPEQEKKAIVAFKSFDETDPNAKTDVETAYLGKKLKLNEEQKKQVRKVVGDFFSDPDIVDKIMGEGYSVNPGPEFTSQVGEEVTVDDQKLNDKIMAEQIGKFLTPEQLKILNQIIDSRYSQSRPAVTSEAVPLNEMSGGENYEE